MQQGGRTKHTGPAESLGRGSLLGGSYQEVGMGMPIPKARKVSKGIQQTARTVIHSSGNGTTVRQQPRKNRKLPSREVTVTKVAPQPSSFSAVEARCRGLLGTQV